MKKLLLISAATLIVSNSTFAGGILTNTNQHAAFLRMLSRGATTEIDVILALYQRCSFRTDRAMRRPTNRGTSDRLAPRFFLYIRKKNINIAIRMSDGCKLFQLWASLIKKH